MGNGSPPPPPNPSSSNSEEPKYGGFTRFEIELEVCTLFLFIRPPSPPSPLLSTPTLTYLQFTQSLSSPSYLNHLASLKLLENPSFIAYLRYLQYFKHPPYLKYLTYPGPTLKNLELLQMEAFRRDILSPEVVGRLVEEGVREAVGGWGGEEVGFAYSR
jgi:mediator of RNA polymerase II transcription subunit 31